MAISIRTGKALLVISLVTASIRAQQLEKSPVPDSLMQGESRKAAADLYQDDYTAAKGAIESVTKTTAREFAAYRVRVNAVSPGPVNTPMLAAVGDDGIKMMGRATLTGRIAEPKEMARTVLALADPQLLSYMTGEVVQANGGMRLD